MAEKSRRYSYAAALLMFLLGLNMLAVEVVKYRGILKDDSVSVWEAFKTSYQLDGELANMIWGIAGLVAAVGLFILFISLAVNNRGLFLTAMILEMLAFGATVYALIATKFFKEFTGAGKAGLITGLSLMGLTLLFLTLAAILFAARSADAKVFAVLAVVVMSVTAAISLFIAAYFELATKVKYSAFIKFCSGVDAVWMYAPASKDVMWPVLKTMEFVNFFTGSFFIMYVVVLLTARWISGRLEELGVVKKVPEQVPAAPVNPYSVQAGFANPANSLYAAPQAPAAAPMVAPAVPETPVYQAPEAPETPAYQAPETPAYQAPVAPEAPVYQAPETPAYQAPAAPEVPSYEAPTYEAPTYEAPTYEAPAYEAPAAEAVEAVPERAAEAVETIADTAENATESFADTAAETFADTTAAVNETIGDATAAVTDAVENTAEAVAEPANAVVSEAAAAAEADAAAMADLIRKYEAQYGAATETVADAANTVAEAAQDITNE